MRNFVSNKQQSAPDVSDKKVRSLAPLKWPPRLPIQEFQKIISIPVSDQSRADFFDHLATLLASGVPLVSGLELIQTSLRSPRLKDAVQRMALSLRAGDRFSEALAAEDALFDRVAAGMIRAAEASGHLEPVSRELAASYSRRAELKAQVLQALAYPMLVALFGLMTVAVLMIFVVPKISSVFLIWDTPLPLLTRFLLGASRFIQVSALPGIILLACAAVFIKTKTRIQTGAVFIQGLQKIPLIKDLFFLHDYVRLNRTWGMLLRNGVPILESIRALREVVTSLQMQDALNRISEKVMRGSRLQETLREESWMPDFAKNLLTIGEETGTLDESFDKISNFYERELRGKLKIISTLIEPLFILIVGISVGFLVAGLLLPIFEMSFVVQ